MKAMVHHVSRRLTSVGRLVSKVLANVARTKLTPTLAPMHMHQPCKHGGETARSVTRVYLMHRTQASPDFPAGEACRLQTILHAARGQLLLLPPLWLSDERIYLEGGRALG